MRFDLISGIEGKGKRLSTFDLERMGLMIGVEVFNGNIDAALRGLAKKIGRDGIFRELKARDRGHKDSDRKKFKAYKATRRRLKLIERRRHYEMVQ